MARLSNKVIEILAAAPAAVSSDVLATKYGVSAATVDKHRKPTTSKARSTRVALQAKFENGQLVLSMSRADILRALAEDA